MRNLSKLCRALTFVLAPSTMLCAAALKVPDLTIGRNLQTDVSIGLPEAAPPGGMQVTVTSSDPKKALISDSADKAGSPSITLAVQAGFHRSPGFAIQALADSGTVTYTVTAPGMGEGTGTVTLVPSAIAILGPYKLATYPTTPKGVPLKLTLLAATLDSTGKVSEEQQIAGGSSVTLHVENSHPEVGSLAESTLTLRGGERETFTSFIPAKEGNSTLSLAMPAGFRTPGDYSSVVIAVKTPGLAVADDLMLGKDLQMGGHISLGDAAGPDGLSVTLVSSDPSKLVLSATRDKLGSGTLTVHVPAGKLTGQYYMQSLSDSGTATYEATAPGFRSRTGKVTLVPSGVIVAYSAYGPPDEAAVLRRIGAEEERSFYTSVEACKKGPVQLRVWTAYLDNGLAADITVQPLRPGVSATVNLTSSNPSVGKVESPVTILSGTDQAESTFLALSPGESIITVDTPPGFSKPKNAVRVPAIVAK